MATNNATNNATPNVAAHAVLISEAGSPVVGVALGAGQILLGQAGADPIASTLANVNTWVDQTTSSVTMAINTGYISDDTTNLITYTLPTTAALGSVIEIVGKGTGLWKVVYTTSQQIVLGSSSSTVTTGNIASTLAADSIRMVCTTANNIWTVVSVIGNITVV